MAIPWAAIPEGSRVRIKRAAEFPQDPALVGKMGTVVSTSEYQTQMLSVTIDGTTETGQFSPLELEIVNEPALPPEREAAKLRRALP